MTQPPKQRAELFKVPWTTHEQHVLEKCLLEFPETEKFRYCTQVLRGFLSVQIALFL